MKSTQRLDYHRFADALVEKGLVEREVLNHTLQQIATTGALLPEILVTEALVSDWELSKAVCDLYHLPFVTVETYPPSPEALEGLDPVYLRQYGLVPLDRFGKVLTVAMPGIVPTEVLEGIEIEEGGQVIPLVGSVETNRRWIMEHLPSPAMPMDSSVSGIGLIDDLEEDSSWTNIFDAGEEAVQLDLKDTDLDQVLGEAFGEGEGLASSPASSPDAVLDASLDASLDLTLDVALDDPSIDSSDSSDSSDPSDSPDPSRD